MCNCTAHSFTVLVPSHHSQPHFLQHSAVFCYKRLETPKNTLTTDSLMQFNTAQFRTCCWYSQQRFFVFPLHTLCQFNKVVLWMCLLKPCLGQFVLLWGLGFRDPKCRHNKGRSGEWIVFDEKWQAYCVSGWQEGRHAGKQKVQILKKHKKEKLQEQNRSMKTGRRIRSTSFNMDGEQNWQFDKEDRGHGD